MSISKPICAWCASSIYSREYVAANYIVTISRMFPNTRICCSALLINRSPIAFGQPISPIFQPLREWCICVLWWIWAEKWCWLIGPAAILTSSLVTNTIWDACKKREGRWWTDHPQRPRVTIHNITSILWPISRIPQSAQMFQWQCHNGKFLKHWRQSACIRWNSRVGKRLNKLWRSMWDSTIMSVLIWKTSSLRLKFGARPSNSSLFWDQGLLLFVC